MLYFKPATVVAPAPVKTKTPVVLKKRFRVHPDGTISPIEDILDWDFDKMNNEREGF